MNWRINRQFRPMVYGSTFIIVIGTLAILAYVLNGWSFGDALYMVILTIYSVGYDEVHPIDTPMLRLVTILVMVLGCTGMIYVTGAFIHLITFNQLQELLGLTRMTKQIERLANHVIICGFGRTGTMLAKELKAGKSDFVIIETSPERFAEARALGYLCLHADATEESVLKQAGIERARALASVVASDPINVFITLSARSLNRAIQIVARGEEPSTEKKLMQAGADAVVLPAHIGAEQIASMILFPSIAGVIQYSARRRQLELDLKTLGLEIELVVVAEGSGFAGLTVEEIEARAQQGFFIIAIERSGRGTIDRPLPTTRVRPGDGVTVMLRSGRAERLDAFGAGDTAAD